MIPRPTSLNPGIPRTPPVYWYGVISQSKLRQNQRRLEHIGKSAASFAEAAPYVQTQQTKQSLSNFPNRKANRRSCPCHTAQKHSTIYTADVWCKVLLLEKTSAYAVLKRCMGSMKVRVEKATLGGYPSVQPLGILQDFKTLREGPVPKMIKMSAKLSGPGNCRSQAWWEWTCSSVAASNFEWTYSKDSRYHAGIQAYLIYLVYSFIAHSS